MKPLLPLALSVVTLFSVAHATAGSEVLSYWNFNNAPTGSEKGFGMWNTEPAAFGEAFDTDKKYLYSNKEGGVIFSGDNIYLDLSSLAGAPGKSWGVFVDSKINKIAGDSSQGGSLVIGALDNSNNITFALSSLGYKDLEISFASRQAQAAVIQWSWSTDNSTYTQFDEESGGGVFHPITINLSAPGGKGLQQLDNQKAIYLRATFLFPSKKGNVALDNFQLTGEPVSR